jgi:hypothetical protein
MFLSRGFSGKTFLDTAFGGDSQPQHRATAAKWTKRLGVQMFMRELMWLNRVWMPLFRESFSCWPD